MTHAPLVELDTTTPAVILKLDRNVMHHGGLGAIRSLGRLGVPVYGVHEDPWHPRHGRVTCTAGGSGGRPPTMCTGCAPG